jgi:hypothetical protein
MRAIIDLLIFYILFHTSLVYLDVKLHVGGFLGACANKTYLLFGPPGITPDAGMLRSGVYNKLSLVSTCTKKTPNM